MYLTCDAVTAAIAPPAAAVAAVLYIYFGLKNMDFQIYETTNAM